MYIEQKTGKHAGEARIGRVTYSKSGRTIYYKDKVFLPTGGKGIYGNYDGYNRAAWDNWINKPIEQSGCCIPGYLGEFWISGPKKNGMDHHHAEPQWNDTVIDEDVWDEYWHDIRNLNVRSLNVASCGAVS